MQMDSTETSLLQQQDDHLLIIRKRNKFIIISIFSLIISLSLIIGVFIVSIIHKNNSHLHQSLLQNSAIREFCYVTRSEINCVASLSSAVKTTPFSNPNQILQFSLNKSITDLNDAVSLTSGYCSSSLSHGLSQIETGLDLIRVKPDPNTLTDNEKKDVMTWIVKAIEDLRSCVRELGENELKVKVRDIMVWLMYGRDYLKQSDLVNENFRTELMRSVESWRNGFVEDLVDVSLFGTQYLVFVLLFCLLLRCYR